MPFATPLAGSLPGSETLSAQVSGHQIALALPPLANRKDELLGLRDGLVCIAVFLVRNGRDLTSRMNELTQDRRSTHQARVVLCIAYRWRAGIEGRIARLRRDYGWRKSAYHGQEGMERWLGLGVIASNLRHIAQGQGA